MRALVVCEFPTPGGGERSLAAVLPTLQRAGWTLDFACPSVGPWADALRRRGLKIAAALDRPPGAASRKDDRYERLAKVLRAERYDLLHANSLAMSLLAATATRDFGVPALGHLRDIVRLSAAKIAQLNLHTRLLAVSAATRAFHLAQGLAAEKTFVLYNGVDLEEFRPRAAADDRLHRELGLPSETPLVGLVGQVILRKGFDAALTALVAALRTRPEVRAVVVGERLSDKPETVEYERRLHAIVAEGRIADRVHWLGRRDDVADVLRASALLLHLPRQEPLGRVLLEAAACATPIVTTDVGGTREIFPAMVADGAWLVPVDDDRAAAAACGQLLDDAALRARIGAAGRRRMCEVFSVEQAATGLLRHYEEVARSGQA